MERLHRFAMPNLFRYTTLSRNPCLHSVERIYVAFHAIRERCCFEDFDYRRSRQKTAFFKEWYYTRTKHPQISLESFKEDYENAHDGMKWDIPDESFDLELEAVGQIQVNTFLKTLSEKDKRILGMRINRFTLEEIAEKPSYANHRGDAIWQSSASGLFGKT